MSHQTKYPLVARFGLKTFGAHGSELLLTEDVEALLASGKEAFGFTGEDGPCKTGGGSFAYGMQDNSGFASRALIIGIEKNPNHRSTESVANELRALVDKVEAENDFDASVLDKMNELFAQLGLEKVEYVRAEQK